MKIRAAGAEFGLKTQPLPEILPDNPLAAAYLTDFGRVAGLFLHDPSQAASFGRRVKYLDECWRGNRVVLAGALEAYNRSLGAGPATLANAGRLSETGTLAVLTGQQAGALTGPLFTVYKAITALALARRWERELGRPVIPVFWVASEDHDFQEIAEVNLINREGAFERLRLEPEKGGRLPGRVSVGDLPVGPEACRLADTFFRQVPFGPGTNYSEVWRQRVMEELSASKTLAGWFARIMTRLFQGTGLVLIDPMDRDIRRLQAPFFQRAAENAEGTASALENSTERVQSLGLPPALQTQPGFSGLFIFHNGERRPLYREDDLFFLRGGGENWTRGELAETARTRPWSFSPSAALRPVSQDWIFPTLAYVAGPGEIAYFGQLRPVYQVFGLEPPVIYPRASLTLILPGIARRLEKEGLTPSDFLLGSQDWLKHRRDEAIRRQDSAGLFKELAGFRLAVDEEYAKLKKLAKDLDKSLEFAADESRRQVRSQIGRFEERVCQSARRKAEDSIRRLDEISVALRPAGYLQERVLNIFQYLPFFQPGEGFDQVPAGMVSEILRAVDIGKFAHKLVFLNTADRAS